jgi:hypothetical protein
MWYTLVKRYTHKTFVGYFRRNRSLTGPSSKLEDNIEVGHRYIAYEVVHFFNRFSIGFNGGRF